MLTLAVAAPAGAGISTITYRVVFDHPGPYGTKEVVHGSVWLDWWAPEQGEPGVAVAHGSFRLRMDGRGDFLLPEERWTDQLQEPIPPDRTPWVEGRRPPWAAPGQDGFRNPPVDPPWFRYRVDRLSDELSLLTGEQAAFPSGVLLGQWSANTIGELLVTDATFELFRFRLTTPESGAGTIVVAPMAGGQDSSYHTSAAGAARFFERVDRIGASITYIPAPSAVAMLIVGVMARRRRV